MTIIDFNNVLFSSIYGNPVYNRKGINTNGIRGFFMKIKTILDMFEPNYLVFARDISRSRTFRRKLYSGYKANRGATDPDILAQMQITQQLVALLGFPILSYDGYEADDIIGMVSKLGADNNINSIIISADKDMYQLINQHVSVMAPNGHDIINTGYLMSEYELTPDQWIELKMLQGDRSDNIPGVPGIGTKTAMILMRRYSTIDNIYDHLSELKPSIQRALIASKPDLPLLRKLVTIECDYDKINLSIDSLYRREVYQDEVWNILIENELYSLFDTMRFRLFPQEHDRLEVYHGTSKNYQI